VKSSLKIKKRKRDTHKGDYGHVLVIAGSLGMTGAAYLCSEAALLSGAGLVTLGIPKSLNSVMERKLTEVMTLPLPETKEQTLSKTAYRKIVAFAKKCDCFAIGPGLSQNKETQALIRLLIKDLKLPMIIDADALNAISGHLSIFRAPKTANREPKIITPHPGEMSRLFDKSSKFIQKNKKTVAKKFASEYNVTTVLKGCKTIVASPAGSIYVNTTGNPGMASGGCGDVLTGILASLLACGIDAFKGARLGVYVHGLCADIAAKEKTEISLRATDLLKFLPEAFKKIYD